MRLRIDNREVFSSIIIEAEELIANNDEVVLQLTGTNLDKKDWFSKSDPFIEIYKQTDSGDYTLVHKTEVFFILMKSIKDPSVSFETAIFSPSIGYNVLPNAPREPKLGIVKREVCWTDF